MSSMVSLRHSLKTRITLSILALFLVSLWSLSIFASRMWREDVARLLGDQQFSTALHVAATVNHALNDRLQALQAVADTMSPSMTGSPVTVQSLLDGLPLVHRLFNGGILVYRLDGTLMVSTPRSAVKMASIYQNSEALVGALKAGKSMVDQPVMGGQPVALVFGMTVPIRNAQGQVVGALMGVTNLNKANFLDQIAESHYGATGDYQVVAPQPRLVVAGTDRSRLMEVLPAAGTHPAIDRFFQGRGASGVVLNPLGVEVLASSADIPLADWYVMASLPTVVAFAPVQAIQRRMLMVTVLLTLLAGALTWLLLRRQLAHVLDAARMLSTLSETSQLPTPLPITRSDEVGQLIGGFNRLLESLRQREEALRIAAIAFECQEGMIVTDANRVILRTNQSFTRIMGYTNEEVRGKTTDFMRSDQHTSVFFNEAWVTARRVGSWQAEVWHQRKSGEVFAQRVTSTAVKNAFGEITHFVITHVDITRQKQQEQQRLRDEAAHRATLVREVHHRIKNNLQGISGLLRQFAQKHPETAEPMNQAISQVQGISIIHGLQGSSVTSAVRLCELIEAIAQEIQALWQTTVVLDMAPHWIPAIIAEAEAVPMALVLNELVVNAIKHGGKVQGQVRITLRAGSMVDTLQISITNAGYLAPDYMQPGKPRNGLQLIAALMPRHGARIVREQHGHQVVTLLELGSPIIILEQKEA